MMGWDIVAIAVACAVISVAALWRTYIELCKLRAMNMMVDNTREIAYRVGQLAMLYMRDR